MKFKLNGSAADFFAISIGGAILSVITLGIMLPVVFYWQLKYLVDHIEVEK